MCPLGMCLDTENFLPEGETNIYLKEQILPYYCAKDTILGKVAVLMRKTDPDFPGKLLHTWPLLSGLILLLGVCSGLSSLVDYDYHI